MSPQASPNMRAGDLPPAAPIYTTLPIKEPGPVVERKDYVAPKVTRLSEVPGYENAPGHMEVIGVHFTHLLSAHKFIEINAIHPEHKALADKIREILEGR